MIHHERNYQVMTNSPVFEQQLTLNSYWSRVEQAKTLPGSHQSEDRFVRSVVLETEAGLNLSGDISDKFAPSKPIVYLAPAK